MFTNLTINGGSAGIYGFYLGLSTTNSFRNEVAAELNLSGTDSPEFTVS